MPIELWVKAVHIMAVIAWMAGLFYLPRLFVYHCKAAAGSELSETLKVMEAKLLRFIMNPAMIAVWFFGVMVGAVQHQLGEPWLHAKLALVVLMTVYHMLLATWRKAFEADRNVHTERFFRLINEVPTVLMAGIVLLVVLKPFS